MPDTDILIVDAVILLVSGVVLFFSLRHERRKRPNRKANHESFFEDEEKDK